MKDATEKRDGLSSKPESLGQQIGVITNGGGINVEHYANEARSAAL